MEPIELRVFYKLVVIFCYSFFTCYWIAQWLINKFHEKGLTCTDMYKKKKPKIANMGGLAIFVGLMVSIVLTQVLFFFSSSMEMLDFERFMLMLYVFYFIVLTFGTFGFLDDMIQINHLAKILATMFMAVPVMFLLQDRVVDFFFFQYDFGWVMSFILAPMYVMVIANLVNMHSGFNGLASGMSIIIMTFLGIRSIMYGEYMHLLLLIPIFGATVAYFLYDRFPSKMIWGNVGCLMVGSAIGAFIIMTKAYWFGVIIFIPHIVDFLMYVYILVTKKEFVKFGGIRKDGTIIAPNPLKMKFLFPYYWRLTEKQTVIINYALVILFGTLALIFEKVVYLS